MQILKFKKAPTSESVFPNVGALRFYLSHLKEYADGFQHMITAPLEATPEHTA